jgi:hypothetical protein
MNHEIASATFYGKAFHQIENNGQTSSGNPREMVFYVADMTSTLYNISHLNLS